MELKLQIPEKYTEYFKDAESLEACFRQNNAKFKEFIRFAIEKDKSVSDIGKELMDAFLSSSEKVNHSIEIVNHSLSDLNKNINDFSNAADKIINSFEKSKILSFINIGLNAANLCSTIAGFEIMSEHLDEISKELSEVSKDVKDVVKHQERLDRKEVEKLINCYANLLNKEKVGDEISLDERYRMVDDMYLTIGVLLDCFRDDIGHREVYYEALSALIPMYIVSICKFDRAHYFEHSCLHISHDKYVKILDELTNLNFFKKIQDYAFLNENLNNRESFDNAFAYIAKVDEQKVAINDNLLIIKHFKDEDEYKDFRQLQNQYLINEIENSSKEVAEVLVQNKELMSV